jgi:hypothetical protein
LRAIGNILTTNDEDIIDRAIFEGVFEKLTSVLYATNANIIKECCWAFSNICAGPVRHIKHFLESPAFERMIHICSSYNLDHRKEALWVICNAITGADVSVQE